VLLNNGFKPVCDLTDCLVPRHAFKLISDPFQRIKQAIDMMLMTTNIQAFAANVALTFQIVFVAPHLGNLVALNANFQSA
jgi:hypothetical protein